jgi:hypothetical protein
MGMAKAQGDKTPYPMMAGSNTFSLRMAKTEAVIHVRTPAANLLPTQHLYSTPRDTEHGRHV